MSEERNGCLLCGADLVYSPAPQPCICSYCGGSHHSTTACRNGHYICDRCHSLGALELIESYCTHSHQLSPLRQASQLMQNPAVKMHGPEHHFLVPAVLISAFCNSRSQQARKAELLALARQRAADVKGGFCGFHGTCGAAMGAGIACSVLTGATPLAGDEWRLSNLMTAECLRAIALGGGPRCCKRDVYAALGTAVPFFNEHLDARLPADPPPRCTFRHLNRECIGARCAYFQP